MSSKERQEFSKENIDTYLKAVAKEYRKMVGKGVPAELILIGGASVLINYGFRDMTTDIDAMIHAASAMKDAVNAVGERYGLSYGWLNADFVTTDSYSSVLDRYSVYYRTYSNVLSIRTIAAEYLIAMKLRSGRQYKRDLSDVVGVLAEHKKRGIPITMEQIRQAVVDLYGTWEALPEISKSFIENVMRSDDFEEMYEQIKLAEIETRGLLVQFEQEYPGVLTLTNVSSVTDNLQKRTNSAEILAQLKARKGEQHE